MHKQIYTKIKQYSANSILAIPTILLITIVGVAPFITAINTSFYRQVYGNSSYVGFNNYSYILGDKGFLFSYNISCLWAILNTVFTIIIGLLLSWKIKNRKKNKILLTSIFIPFAIPIYISVPIWRLFFHGDGGSSIFYNLTGIETNLLIAPYKTFVITMIVNIWLSLPITVIFFSSAIKKISNEILLAAKIDGASYSQILFKIIIPIIKNTTLALIVLNSIKFLKDFNVPYMMSVGGPPLIEGITNHFIIGITTTLDILIYEIFNITDNYGITSAYSVIFMGIIFVLMSLWLIIKSDKENKIFKIILLITTQILINKWIGILFVLLYSISILIKNKNLFKSIIVVELVYLIINIYNKGFLNGFDTAIFPSIIICLSLNESIKLKLLTFKTNKSNKILFNKNFISKNYSSLITDNLIKSITLILEIIMIISSFLIIYILFLISFSKVGTYYINSLKPTFDTFDNYKEIIFKENIFKYIKNSFYISISAGILIPFFIMPFSYFLKDKGEKTTYSVLTILQIIGIYGGMHSLIPLYILFTKINLSQSYVPLVMIYLSHSIPVGLFTTLAFIDKFPKSLFETSKLEGTTQLQYFRYILFPLSLPIILSNVLLTFLSSWNGFIAPLLFLNQDSKFTISVKLYSLVGNLSSGFPHWNLFAAGALINCFILLIVILLLQKQSEVSFLKDFQE